MRVQMRCVTILSQHLYLTLVLSVIPDIRQTKYITSSYFTHHAVLPVFRRHLFPGLGISYKICNIPDHVNEDDARDELYHEECHEDHLLLIQLSSLAAHEQNPHNKYL